MRGREGKGGRKGEGEVEGRGKRKGDASPNADSCIRPWPRDWSIRAGVASPERWNIK